MNRLERPAVLMSFEGIDGCGKSTLLSQMSAWLEAAEIPHLRTREPGGTLMGEAVRSVLLDSSFSGMHPWAEAFMYSASRAQHVSEVIVPALRQGRWVLTDRYVDATMAYQGYGRGLSIECLHAIHQWSTGNLLPDVSVLLDCDVATALERRNRRPGAPDRLERQEKAFHERVRAGYRELAASDPDRFWVLEASRPLPEVTERLRSLVRRDFGLDI